MKKRIISVIVGFMCIFLLTGCGRNQTTLKCSGDFLGMETTVEVKVRNDRPTEIRTEFKIETNDEEEAIELYEEIKEDYEEDANASVRRSGTAVFISYVERASDRNNADALFSDLFDMNIREIRADLEEDGLTCR